LFIYSCYNEFRCNGLSKYRTFFSVPWSSLYRELTVYVFLCMGLSRLIDSFGWQTQSESNKWRLLYYDFIVSKRLHKKAVIMYPHVHEQVRVTVHTCAQKHKKSTSRTTRLYVRPYTHTHFMRIVVIILLDRILIIFE